MQIVTYSPRLPTWRPPIAPPSPLEISSGRRIWCAPRGRATSCKMPLGPNWTCQAVESDPTDWSGPTLSLPLALQRAQPDTSVLPWRVWPTLGTELFRFSLHPNFSNFSSSERSNCVRNSELDRGISNKTRPNINLAPLFLLLLLRLIRTPIRPLVGITLSPLTLVAAALSRAPPPHSSALVMPFDCDLERTKAARRRSLLWPRRTVCLWSER